MNTGWRTRGALAAAVLVASWPVLRWYAARLGDGGDEPWGLVALVLALGLTPQGQACLPVLPAAAVSAGGLVLAAAIGSGWLPMLGRAGFVVLAVGVVSGGGRGALGRIALLGLSLPVLATAQFYAGYPLRVLTAEMGRPLLALAGVATERVGVALTWAGGEVVVDAPCSGVRMLWTGCVLAATLAAALGLNAARTAGLGLAALVGILLANALRATLLFFVEAGIWPAPAWVHEATGLVVFAGFAAGLVCFAWRLQQGEAAMKSKRVPLSLAASRRHLIP